MLAASFFLASAYKDQWSVLSLTVSSSHWQCTVSSILIIEELASGRRWWNRNLEPNSCPAGNWTPNLSIGSPVQWRAEGVRTVRRPRASTPGGIQGASFRKNVCIRPKKEEKNVVNGAWCRTGGGAYKERIFVKFENWCEKVKNVGKWLNKMSSEMLGDELEKCWWTTKKGRQKFLRNLV